jgi:hypothetical protein
MRKIIRREVTGSFDERLDKAVKDVAPDVPRAFVFVPRPGGFQIKALTEKDIPGLDKLPDATPRKSRNSVNVPDSGVNSTDKENQ